MSKEKGDDAIPETKNGAGIGDVRNVINEYQRGGSHAGIRRPGAFCPLFRFPILAPDAATFRPHCVPGRKSGFGSRSPTLARFRSPSLLTEFKKYKTVLEISCKIDPAFRKNLRWRWIIKISQDQLDIKANCYYNGVGWWVICFPVVFA